MSTYREIHGKAVKSVSTDPSATTDAGQIWYNTASNTFKSIVTLEAWSSSGSLVVARDKCGNAGTQTAALGFGGTGALVTSDEYNGTGWKSAPNLNTGREGMASGGTTSAAWKAGGNPPATTNATEEYNGSSWTTVPGTLNTGRYIMGSCGTQTAGLACGGYTGTDTNASEEYNGTSWSEGDNLNTTRRTLTTFGIQTAAISVGGQTPPLTNATESYDGTSWTTLPATYPVAFSDGSSSGTQTAGLIFGGYTSPAPVTTTTNKFNGTTYSSAPAMGTATARGAAAGSQSATVAFGGTSPNPGYTTEEFNISANAVTGAAWAASGALGTARSQISGFGATTDASIGAGGYQYGPNTYTNVSEEYNGSTFSATPNMPVSLGFRNSGGTVTAGIVFGGHDGSSPANTSIWNGSSYSNGPSIVDPGYGTMGNGSSTALFMCGSSEPARPTTLTEEYDGSSWSSVPATLNTGRGNGMGVGSQTAGLAIGGGSPNPTENLMEEYNGSTWTVGHTLVAAMSRSSAQGGSTPQDNTMVAGGNATPTSTAQVYNGTAWTTTASLSTGRGSANGMGAGNSASSMLVAGGNSPSTTASEKFTAETIALNVKTLTQG
tara:strand:+ start:1846 stop:3660 length:1815 start_codon:yes stop_codon:yes gene_type:complete